MDPGGAPHAGVRCARTPTASATHTHGDGTRARDAPAPSPLSSLRRHHDTHPTRRPPTLTHTNDTPMAQQNRPDLTTPTYKYRPRRALAMTRARVHTPQPASTPQRQRAASPRARACVRRRLTAHATRACVRTAQRQQQHSKVPHLSSRAAPPPAARRGGAGARAGGRHTRAARVALRPSPTSASHAARFQSASPAAAAATPQFAAPEATQVPSYTAALQLASHTSPHRLLAPPPRRAPRHSCRRQRGHSRFYKPVTTARSGSHPTQRQFSGRRRATFLHTTVCARPPTSYMYQRNDAMRRAPRGRARGGSASREGAFRFAAATAAAAPAAGLASAAPK